MAQIVEDNYTPKRNKPGPRPKYPWPEWLDGQRRRIVKGEDFNCTVASMADAIRKAAKAAKVELDEVHEEPEAVVFKAKPANTAKKKRSRQ